MLLKSQYPFVICKTDNIFHFNGGYIPSYNDLIDIKGYIDDCLEKYDQESIDKINKDINDYHLKNEIDVIKKLKEKDFSKKDGYIYIYKQNNNYKIGKSIRQDCRVRKYVTENPDKIDLVFKAFVSNYDKAEIELHNLFNNSRISNDREWFKFSNDDILIAKNLSNSVWYNKYVKEINFDNF